MRAFFTWAVENKVVTIDPTKGIKLLRGPNDDVGYHTWTQEELDRFEARWPVLGRASGSNTTCCYTRVSAVVMLFALGANTCAMV